MLNWHRGVSHAEGMLCSEELTRAPNIKWTQAFYISSSNGTWQQRPWNTTCDKNVYLKISCSSWHSECIAIALVCLLTFNILAIIILNSVYWSFMSHYKKKIIMWIKYACEFSTDLSLFGVCTEFCPFGKGWWGIWGETLEAEYEVVLELLVVRSRPSCFMASSVLWTPATSFHNCCRSVGHMAEIDRKQARDYYKL